MVGDMEIYRTLRVVFLKERFLLRMVRLARLLRFPPSMFDFKEQGQAILYTFGLYIFLTLM